MGHLLINCPETGELVDTGVSMTHDQFNDPSIAFEMEPYGCASCGGSHPVSREDAEYQDDELN